MSKRCALLMFVVSVGPAAADDGIPAKEKALIRRPADEGISWTFSPDGKRLAVWGEGNKVDLYDPATGEALGAVAGTGTARAAAFSPDGRVLAVGGHKDVMLFDAVSRKELATLKGHTWYVQFLAFSPDGRRLASQSINGNDANMRLWDVAKGEELAATDGQFGFPVRSPTRATVSFAYYHHLTLVDAESLKAQPLPAAGSDVIACVAYLADGRHIVTGSGQSVALYDLTKAKPLVQTVHSQHTGPVTSVRVSPDGKVLASGSADKTILLWDLDHKKTIRVLKGHAGAVRWLVFSADGKSLYSSSDAESDVRVWAVPTGEPRPALPAQAGSKVVRMELSPDGKVLATAHVGGAVRLWDVSTAR